MAKHQKPDEKRAGYNWNKKLFSLNLRITKSYEKTGEEWKPHKPDFEELEGDWVVIDFSSLSLIEKPILGLVGESDSYYANLEDAIEIYTLRHNTFVHLEIDRIYAVHVLESPEVSLAREVIEDVEKEKLFKALEPGIANPAHVIRKLKGRVSEWRVAELINSLYSIIGGTEDATDESMILGEEMAGGPSKVKKELDEFIDKHESVKQWAEAIEEKQEEIDEMSIEEMLDDTKTMNEKNDDGEIEMYADWLEILSTIRDQKVNEVIRILYFDLRFLKYSTARPRPKA